MTVLPTWRTVVKIMVVVISPESTPLVNLDISLWANQQPFQEPQANPTILEER
jgi:hypothetical protein